MILDFNIEFEYVEGKDFTHYVSKEVCRITTPRKINPNYLQFQRTVRKRNSIYQYLFYIMRHQTING